jgi:hypothetical protein
MGARIDELEKSIGELMTQAGIEVLIPGALVRINQRLFCPSAYTGGVRVGEREQHDLLCIFERVAAQHLRAHTDM